MQTGTRVTWTSYGLELFGTIESVCGQAITVRIENGPMAGKLRIMLAASVTPALIAEPV